MLSFSVQVQREYRLPQSDQWLQDPPGRVGTVECSAEVGVPVVSSNLWEFLPRRRFKVN